jgi:WD40 repeat protein
MPSCDYALFAPDLQTFVAANWVSRWDRKQANTAWLCETPTGRLRARLEHRAAIGCFQFSPDGKVLAVGTGLDAAPTQIVMSGGIVLWNVADGTRLSSAGSEGDGWLGLEQTHALAYSPDGKTLASGTAQGTIELRESATLKRFGHLVHEKPPSWAIEQVEFAPNGKLLASLSTVYHPLSTDAVSVKVWDLKSRQELACFKDHYLRSMKFATDGKILATISVSNEFPWNPFSDVDDTSKHVVIWDLGSRKPVTKLVVKSSYPLLLAPDCRRLASWDNDHRLHLWDVAGKRIYATIDGRASRTAAFTPDGKYLVGELVNGDVMAWEVLTGTAKQKLGNNSSSYARVFTFSRDGKTVATWHGSNRTQLWSLKVE